jgi:hypothetical protein
MAHFTWSVGRLPKPARVWLGDLVPELLLPFVTAGAHLMG